MSKLLKIVIPAKAGIQKNGGLIPTLRFPEFENAPNWNLSQLGRISDRITKKVGDRKLTTVSITAGQGFVSQAEKFSRDISGKQYKNYIVLRVGEFSYNKGNSKTFPQGAVYRLKEFEEVAAPNAFISFRFKASYVPDFYKGYFDNNYHGRQLLKFITSGARSDGLLNISPDDFFSIMLPTPVNKEEQQKIADCLSSLDELIAAHTQKHKTLQSHKKGLMQNLFPAEDESIPALRFPEFENAGEWEESVLENIARYRRGSFPQPYGLPEWYDDENGMPFIQVFDVSDDMRLKPDTKRKISKLAAKQSVFIEQGTVIITIQGSIGRVAITHYDAYIDRTLLLFQEFLKPIEKIFFAYAIQILFELERLKAPGGIIKTITKEALSSFIVKLPSTSEQQKIADCLSSVDDLITAQAQKIEALKTHKKGLMQQLFPDMNEVST